MGKLTGLKYISIIACISALTLQLVGCGGAARKQRYSIFQDGPPAIDVDVSKIPDPVPKAEPFSRYGNPSSYSALGRKYYVMKSYLGYSEKGIASWYGMKFHNHRTSSGEPYNIAAMTAAHKTLPIPCYVLVTNLKTGKRVTVKVNDRGPFHENRIIDLSYVAAKKLGVFPAGTALVQVTAIDPRNLDAAMASVPAKPSNPILFMQIGAFAQRDNAVRLVAAIKPYTQAPIQLKEGVLNGNPIYRVHIGPIKNVDSSDELHHQLLVHQLGQPMTVIE